jgi:hypothetical protein
MGGVNPAVAKLAEFFRTHLVRTWDRARMTVA